MLKKQICQWITFILILLAFTTTVIATPLSINIPLNSPVYTYLTKLDGLGYLQYIQTGTKPYTRMQVAQWVRQIKESVAHGPQLPDYAQVTLQKLETEFSYELSLLSGENSQKSLQLKELSWSNTYYEGNLLKQSATLAHYQPLYTNQNGYRLAEGLNSILTVDLTGQLADHLSFSLEPRLSCNEDDHGSVDLTSGYLVTGFGNLRIQLGKDQLWWGPGEWGNLSLTNNMEAVTSLKISNIDPIPLGGIVKFLGRMNASAFYAGLNGQRTDVSDPSLIGLRLESMPTDNFTFGGSLNSMIGGQGHKVGFDDLWDYLTGKNAETAGTDKWNSIAGFDFRWRVPQNRLQVYGAIYGEDQAGKVMPLPSKNAYLVGLYFPRLTADGSWDAQVEAAQTGNCWYIHSVYTDGYVDQDQIIGDAMGYNADRYSAQVSHYFTDGSRLTFFIEHLVMNKDHPNPQTVNSWLVTYRRELVEGLTLCTAAGSAAIEHLNFQADQEDRNYLFSLKLEKQF